MTDRCKRSCRVNMAPGSSPSPATRPKTKRVSSQHTLERVRNNQRQHRARRRAYVTTLETKLSEAEQSVADLRRQVEALQAEHAQCNQYTNRELFPIPYDDTPPSSLPGATLGTTLRVSEPRVDTMTFGDAVPPPAASSTTNLAVLGNLPISLFDGLGNPRHDPDEAVPEPVHDVHKSLAVRRTLHQSCESIAASVESMESISALGSHAAPDLFTFAATSETLLPATATSDRLLNAIGTCSCCGASANSQEKVNSLDPISLVRNPESPVLPPDYVAQLSMEAYFKPSANDESTVLCSEAYLLIAQQNLKGVSQEDVTTWLWNGFRKSVRPGWGCRVKTDTLFSLLAFISES